jgi:acetolactate synthase-1/2/3 large subunit
VVSSIAGTVASVGEIKLSDYVAEFLAQQGIRHAFVVSGGSSLHLIHSIDSREDITHICPHHEQAGAMAADAYARAGGGLGCAVATSGPGATNLITGICCAFFDSVPVLYITGQVSTFRFKGKTGVRQMGFQETDIVEVCKPITKYAVLIEDARRIRYELEKAAFIAREGRPGPVLIDIPDNLQRELIDPTLLESFLPPPASEAATPEHVDITALLASAERPVAILGWGVHLSGARREALEFLDRSGIPFVPTWGTLDLLPVGHPQRVGSFGTHGVRAGNFAVQNADLLIAVGARLDTHEIGSPASDFARGAKKVVVDIDHAELDKFEALGVPLEAAIRMDARAFLGHLNARLANVHLPDYAAWMARIAGWQHAYPAVRPACRQAESANPYLFMELLSARTPADALVISDTGCAVAWSSQAFAFKDGQRFFHAFNNTPMGYALPASIGAALAVPGKPVVCIVGDGSLQMNVQELATLAYHRLPVKVFVLNNRGYGMIQQTQDQWLGSRYIASSYDGGLGFPDFVKLAGAYGLAATRVDRNADLAGKIDEIFSAEGPMLCSVDLNPDERVIPQVKYGRPIEDAEPLLPRDEFFGNMLIEPTSSSKSLA